MNIGSKLIVKPGKRFKLSEHNPEETLGFKTKEEVASTLEKNKVRLADLQYLLYAENKRSVLIVLQAIDAGGKDGTIRHVMSALNPQGCSVTGFKVPSVEEADHDFLWRIHRAVPARGDIGIFNRSHYEEVLAVRVHNLVPKSVWSQRYEQINGFEKFLTENNVKILKFFLYISKDEQKKRFQRRIDDPKKHWKLDEGDFEKRKYWNDYMRAFEDALNRCSTPWAPWYVIPANNKWFRNFAVSEIIVEVMEDLDMKFPKTKIEVSKLKLQ
jgi:PPK2 family polyphosphate:nucleotide phosphotransferase